MITRKQADALVVRKQPEAALRKWLNEEALGAYGANLVDDPEDHEAAKADNLIGGLARTVIALWDRVDRLTSAGIDAAAQLRVIAGMDLVCASAVAYNAVRPLEALLKETTRD